MYIALAVVGASIPTGFIIYTKVLGKKIPLKVRAAIPIKVPVKKPDVAKTKMSRVQRPTGIDLTTKLRKEIADLRMISEQLKIRGREITGIENELRLAENALQENLIDLSASHLRKARMILKEVSK
jgi:hypothetical protein